MNRIFVYYLKLLFIIIIVLHYSKVYGNKQNSRGDSTSVIVSTVDSLFSLATNYISFDNEIALLYAKQGREFLGDSDYEKGFHDYYYIRARVAYYNDDYANAKKWLDSVSLFLDQNINSLGLAQFYSLNSSILACEGDFQKATEFTMKSIRVREELDDKVGLALNMSFLGNLYLAQGDVENAEKHYTNALNLNIKPINPVAYGKILANMGKLKNRQDSVQEAKKYFNKAHDLLVQNGDLRGVASSSTQIARIAKQEQKFDEAVTYLKEAEQIYLKLNEKYGRTSVLIELSSCLRESGKFELAEENGNLALSIAQQINSEPLMASAFLAISKANKELGNYKKALENFESYFEINSKLISRENNKKLSDLEHQADILEKEKNIALLSQKNRIKSLQLFLLVLAAGLILFASIFIVYFQRSRNKQLEQKHQLLQERNKVVEVENKLNEQQKEMLENDLELKNKELASKALALLQLNETLQDIGEKISEVKTNSDEFAPQLKNQIIREIHQATHNNIWEEFDVAFKQVHNTFYEKLLDKCPNLSSTEIKIAALLRLNLSTKEIASISFKSESAVKIARHRIRTKLGLNSNENLISYLIKL